MKWNIYILYFGYIHAGSEANTSEDALNGAGSDVCELTNQSRLGIPINPWWECERYHQDSHAKANKTNYLRWLDHLLICSVDLCSILE